MPSSSSSTACGRTSTRTTSTAPSRNISVGHGAMAAPAKPQKKSPSALTLRIISAAVLIPIVVAAVYVGAPIWDLLVAVFGVAMAWEWSRIVARGLSARRNQPFSYSGGPAALIGLVTGALVLLAVRAGLPTLPAVPHIAWIFLLAATFFVTLPALSRYKSAAFWFPLGLWYV